MPRVSQTPLTLLLPYPRVVPNTAKATAKPKVRRGVRPNRPPPAKQTQFVPQPPTHQPLTRTGYHTALLWVTSIMHLPQKKTKQTQFAPQPTTTSRLPAIRRCRVAHPLMVGPAPPQLPHKKRTRPWNKRKTHNTWTAPTGTSRGRRFPAGPYTAAGWAGPLKGPALLWRPYFID